MKYIYRYIWWIPPFDKSEGEQLARVKAIINWKLEMDPAPLILL